LSIFYGEDGTRRRIVGGKSEVPPDVVDEWPNSEEKVNGRASVISNQLKRNTSQGRLMRKVRRGDDPDFDLVEKSKAGDGAAFEELLSRHYGRTHALIFGLTDAGRADDLTQETFVLAYRNLHRFRGEATFSTWLTRIAVNMCRSEWRKGKKRRETWVEDHPLEAIAEKAGANGKSGPAAMMEAERGERIDREIGALPPKLRVAFTLRYIEGYSRGEVAAILSCKEGTVGSRLFNARQILKVRLRDLVE